jgi:hypothetical protein
MNAENAVGNEFLCDWRKPRQAALPHILSSERQPKTFPARYELSFEGINFVKCMKSQQMLGLPVNLQKAQMVDTLLCGDKRISEVGSSTTPSTIFTRTGMPIPAYPRKSSESTRCIITDGALTMTREINYTFVVGADDGAPDSGKKSFTKKIISTTEYSLTSVTF